MLEYLKAFYPLGNTTYEAEMRLKTRMAVLWTAMIVVGVLVVSRFLCW